MKISNKKHWETMVKRAGRLGWEELWGDGGGRGIILLEEEQEVVTTFIVNTCS